jgi:branched-chain amino acid transport system ATP-binding protein
MRGRLLANVCDLFPALRDKLDAQASALSGGQQQMVAIGRALMANPKLLICDEMSLGLAPITATISPAEISRSIPNSAWKSP